MIDKQSILWAIDFIHKNSDGDLFPRILEIDAIKEVADTFADKLLEDIPKVKVNGNHRRFIVPKDNLSYRQATQLDLQDSIVLTALIYQYGELIEKKRMPSDIVFSYRFKPDIESGLYDDKDVWKSFWKTAQKRANSKQTTVLYCDIADFYNQIYHHTIENQLSESSLPKNAIAWLKELIQSTTAKVSRGVPIGPHPIHLIAEASMIPIDNSLSLQGIDFIRYVDDMIVFCKSPQDAQLSLYKIALTLDLQQRIMLQRHKTRIFNSAYEFQSYCDKKIANQPISIEEDRILKLINKYSSDDPYKVVYYEDINDEDWGSISDDILTSIIQKRLSEANSNFERLRWFYRRLTQIGHPGGVNVTFENINKLMPCFANVCIYLGSIQKIDPKKWKLIGTKLMTLLNTDIVRNNSYFKLLLLSLFSKNRELDHFPSLTNMFHTSESYVKREILLAAKINNAYDWIREQKESFNSMESWVKMAYLYCSSGLPRDERRFFLRGVPDTSHLITSIKEWAR
jgi:retron-type reverse transcriptase